MNMLLFGQYKNVCTYGDFFRTCVFVYTPDTLACESETRVYLLRTRRWLLLACRRRLLVWYSSICCMSNRYFCGWCVYMLRAVCLVEPPTSCVRTFRSNLVIKSMYMHETLVLRPIEQVETGFFWFEQIRANPLITIFAYICRDWFLFVDETQQMVGLCICRAKRYLSISGCFSVSSQKRDTAWSRIVTFVDTEQNTDCRSCEHAHGHACGTTYAHEHRSIIMHHGIPHHTTCRMRGQAIRYAIILKHHLLYTWQHYTAAELYSTANREHKVLCCERHFGGVCTRILRYEHNTEKVI